MSSLSAFMEMPDVTRMQGGVLAGFGAVVLGAPTVGYEGQNLAVLIISTALLGAASVLADAIIRHGRAGTLAAEMQGMQANLALTGAYTDAVQQNGGSDA